MRSRNYLPERSNSLCCWPIVALAFSWLTFFPSGILCAAETDKAAVDFFETKIRPVLVAECYACHSEQAESAGKLRGSLWLDSRKGTRKGGDTGPAVVPGQAAKSLLLSALRHDDYEMPPKGKLSEAIIADFEQWIASGAYDPRSGAANVQSRGVDWGEARNHWAFQPLAKPTVNESLKDTLPAHPIDQFIRREQEAIQVRANATADRRTLIRRAWFDLLGLPPTAEDMEKWLSRLEPLNDSSDETLVSSAWQELIDHLLDSPLYGERMARHWMDVARFAESHGYEQDYDRPHAYHYRDFLIKAFNADMPYDKFVRWQLAGDEFAPDDPMAWMATGFLGGGAFPTQLTEAEFESARYDELDDIVATTGVAFLGLSIGCARCHDHKFDPITTREYYQFAATFTSVIRCEKLFDLAPEANRAIRQRYQAELAAMQLQLSELEQAMPTRLAEWISTVPDPSASRTDGPILPSPKVDAQLERLRQLIDKPKQTQSESTANVEQILRATTTDWQAALIWFTETQPDWRELRDRISKEITEGPPLELTRVQVASEGLPPMKHHADGRGYPHFYPQVHLLRRGDVAQKGDVMFPAPLEVLVSKAKPIDWASEFSEDKVWDATSSDIPLISTPVQPSNRRSRLATWIVDPSHGSGTLAARVMINRLWQYHFGRGIVTTPNDFGFSGEKPTHPELLDWLAQELIDGDWKLKRMHRLIMTSRTYMRSSSRAAPLVRDRSADDLQGASSDLDPDNRTWWRREPRRLEAEALRDSLLSVSGLLDRTRYGPGTLDETMRRRSIYFFIKRSQLIPSMMLFDWPEHLVSIGQRSSTTIAPQALMLMNGELVRQASYGMAERVLSESGPGPPTVRTAIVNAYRLTYQRSPTAEEVQLGTQFLGVLSAARSEPSAKHELICPSSKVSDISVDCWTDYCQTLLSTNEFIYVD